MIICDYCPEPAGSRLGVASWHITEVEVQGGDFDDLTRRLRRLSAHRYACPEHALVAYADVRTAVGPEVPLETDKAL